MGKVIEKFDEVPLSYLIGEQRNALSPQDLTSNDRSFVCPIIYTDTIHYGILFIDTSTMFDTTKHIL